uniref:PA n=1 Tax=Wenling hagfish influenza virus TaxID=2116481 RepID=A0A2P1GNR4_9ORTO|nr:PA [Wenling hagfish influenza virus]
MDFDQAVSQILPKPLLERARQVAEAEQWESTGPGFAAFAMHYYCCTTICDENTYKDGKPTVNDGQPRYTCLEGMTSANADFVLNNLCAENALDRPKFKPDIFDHLRLRFLEIGLTISEPAGYFVRKMKKLEEEPLIDVAIFSYQGTSLCSDPDSVDETTEFAVKTTMLHFENSLIALSLWDTYKEGLGVGTGKNQMLLGNAGSTPNVEELNADGKMPDSLIPEFMEKELDCLVPQSGKTFEQYAKLISTKAFREKCRETHLRTLQTAMMTEPLVVCRATKDGMSLDAAKAKYEEVYQAGAIAHRSSEANLTVLDVKLRPYILPSPEVYPECPDTNIYPDENSHEIALPRTLEKITPAQRMTQLGKILPPPSEWRLVRLVLDGNTQKKVGIEGMMKSIAAEALTGVKSLNAKGPDTRFIFGIGMKPKKQKTDEPYPDDLKQDDGDGPPKRAPPTWMGQALETLAAVDMRESPNFELPVIGKPKSEIEAHGARVSTLLLKSIAQSHLRRCIDTMSKTSEALLGEATGYTSQVKAMPMGRAGPSGDYHCSGFLVKGPSHPTSPNTCIPILSAVFTTIPPDASARYSKWAFWEVGPTLDGTMLYLRTKQGGTDLSRLDYAITSYNCLIPAMSTVETMIEEEAERARRISATPENISWMKTAEQATFPLYKDPKRRADIHQLMRTLAATFFLDICYSGPLLEGFTAESRRYMMILQSMKDDRATFMFAPWESIAEAEEAFKNNPWALHRGVMFNQIVNEIV